MEPNRKLKKVKKAKISAKKSDKSSSKSKIVGPVALIILVSTALLGFFWQDSGFAIPDWLNYSKKFFL